MPPLLKVLGVLVTPLNNYPILGQDDRIKVTGRLQGRSVAEDIELAVESQRAIRVLANNAQAVIICLNGGLQDFLGRRPVGRSEEHTSELQSH